MPTKHGMADCKEYRIWAAVKRRTTSKRAHDYERYGGSGVTMCEEWQNDFAAFFAHIGPRPGPNYSIDRIDNAKGYEPGNVRWATAIEQQNNKKNNRRVSYQGTTMTVAEAVRAAGNKVTRENAICRLGNGWSVQDAVETPPLFRRDPATRKIIRSAA